MNDAKMKAQPLVDQRSGKVVFLSHCILNENTRYPGGACRACCVQEIIEQCIASGTGIVQMPCPEQHAWGGVTKRLLLTTFGLRSSLLYRLRGVLVPLVLFYTRLVYRRLARQVAAQIRDYQASGFVVVGVVGIDGSPSCGVSKTLDLRRAFDMALQMQVQSALSDTMNQIVRRCVTAGSGLFAIELRRALKRGGRKIPLFAHDLIAELDGKRSTVILPV